MRYVIGLDIGGTAIKAACVTPEGVVLSKESVSTFATEAGWPQRVLERVGELEQAYKSPADAIGVAAPGIAAPDGRSIWWMQGRLAELQGLDWTDFLERPAPVRVLNDAQAALLGEVWQGAARGCANVMMLTLGTGVGGAAMVDGKLLRGHLGRAGHLGHICLDPAGPLDIVGTPGSLEEAVGDCGIERRSGGRFKSTAELLVACLKGDEYAQRLWRDSLRALACGIASLVNVLDPEVVIVGGGLMLAGPMLFDTLRGELERVEWQPHGRRVRLVPPAAAEFAGAIGAAYNALNPA